MSINIFGPKILELRFVETTKEVHKVINIFISKRYLWVIYPWRIIVTCLKVNGRNRGRHFVASRVWCETLGSNCSEDYCLLGHDIMQSRHARFYASVRRSWGIQHLICTRIHAVFLGHFENLTDILSRNVGKQLPIHATIHPWISRSSVPKFLKRKSTDSPITSVHTWCLQCVSSQKAVTFKYYIHTLRGLGEELDSCNEFSELLGLTYSEQNNWMTCMSELRGSQLIKNVHVKRIYVCVNQGCSFSTHHLAETSVLRMFEYERYVSFCYCYYVILVTFNPSLRCNYW
jgi:hypothetical protein